MKIIVYQKRRRVIMSVEPVKALDDNYIWVYTQASDAVVVDPGEASPILTYLQEHNLDVITILLTHDHDDHTAGVKKVLEVYPKASVIGPKETERFNTQTVAPGDALTLFEQEVKVLLTAGHTSGHISYFTNDMLFCGDALFSAGCGRVFTGDYQAQYDALKIFSELSDNTRVFAGHEYTETNLKFAQSLAEYPEAVDKKLTEVSLLRMQDIPTLPSTIGQEKEINVFLQADTLADFKALRDKRDNF